MNVAVGFTIVLGALGLLMGGIRLAQRRRAWAPELSRKAVHVGMGSVCLALPWLFRDAWPVWVIAALATAALSAVRWWPALRARFGGVLGGVARESWGELLFAPGVAAVFAFAHGTWWKFCVPVAVLTFADTAGALVGGRFGRTPVRTFDGAKSVEGCAAVFATAAACVAFPLGLGGGATLAWVVPAAFAIGLLAMLAEAAAWRGMDNVILPLAVFAQLTVYAELPAGALWLRVGVMAALVVAVFLYKPRTNLDDGGLIVAALGLYLAWALGGWPWLLAPAAVFLSYLRLVPANAAVKRKVHGLPAVMSVGAGAFCWMIAGILVDSALCLVGFTVGLATQLGMIAREEFTEACPTWSRRRVFVAAVGVAGLLVVVPSFVALPGLRTEFALVAGVMMAGVAAILPVQRWFEGTRWGAPGATRLVVRAALGFAASVVATVALWALPGVPIGR